MSAPPRKPTPMNRAPPAAGARSPSSSVRRPRSSAFEPAPDPIDEDKFPGDLQGDADHTLDSVQSGFRERMAAEAARFKRATDASYYFVVVCETGAQADVLLDALGGERKAGDLFVDGRAVADHLGVDLPKADLVPRKAPKIDPRLSRLVRRPGSK